ncbi:hypothetical protein A9Q94_14870, partial [Rhodobacterales bacterium 56_14_T64]
KNGIGGYWATQILPFADGVSFPGYMDFESAVYAALSGQLRHFTAMPKGGAHARPVGLAGFHALDRL